MKQAISFVFKGEYLIYSPTGLNDALIEIYESKEYQQLCEDGNGECEMFGFCKPLIEHFEQVLNK